MKEKDVLFFFFFNFFLFPPPPFFFSSLPLWEQLIAAFLDETAIILGDEVCMQGSP